MSRIRVRCVLPLVLLGFFAFAASAQAHDATASVGKCTSSAQNTIVITWYDFANPPGPGNGGENTPTWSIVYTPTGGSPTTYSGQVSFPLNTYTLTVDIPGTVGSAVVSTSWTPSETTDGNGPTTLSTTLAVANCATVATTPSASSVSVGQPFSDQAVLSGGTTSPAPTGTITFNLYAASDTTCSTPLATSTATVDGDGSYSSSAVTESQPGTYQWVASYSGDATNNSFTGPCVDPAEQVTVVGSGPPPPPPITLSTAASSTADGALVDNAILGGGISPTGTITFTLYKEADSTCSTPLSTSTVTVDGDGTYTSPAVTGEPRGQTYQWTASYSGDASNLGLDEGCGGTNESAPLPDLLVGISTTASPGLKPGAQAGGKISDVVKLSGAASGPAPTGTITFNLYKASDRSCKTPLATRTVTVNHGAGSYTSPGVTENVVGTYQWVASYSGDANYAAAAALCHPPGTAEEVSVVVPPCTALHLYGVPRSVSTSPKTGKGDIYAKGSFSPYVPAHDIKSVTFTLDGKPLATMTKPKKGSYGFTVYVQLNGKPGYTLTINGKHVVSGYKVPHTLRAVETGTSTPRCRAAAIFLVPPHKPPPYTG